MIFFCPPFNPVRHQHFASWIISLFQTHSSCALTSFRFSRNFKSEIVIDQQKQQILQLLSQSSHTTLTHLDLTGLHINIHHAQILQQMTQLSRLHLGYNPLSIDVFQFLSQLDLTHPHLSHLDVSLSDLDNSLAILCSMKNI